MGKKLDHEDAMELAVQLTCSYLTSSHSPSLDAEDLIVHYYRQVRGAEKRLAGDDAATRVVAGTALEQEVESAEEEFEENAL